MVQFLSKLTDIIVHGFHNAFRKDIYNIDIEILRIGHSGGDIIPWFDRLQTFAEFLDYHARGEEAAVFPGDLPDNPKDALKPDAAPAGLNFVRFRPPRVLPPGPDGEVAALPHIRLDRALDFLLADWLA